MKFELNNSLENPTVFFEVEGQPLALDLIDHVLYECDEEGMIFDIESDIEFYVEQDYDNEITKFVFATFVIGYSCGELFVCELEELINASQH